MRAMTPNSVISSVRRAIHDPNGTRWSDAVLRQYILEGEKIIVDKHPEAQYVNKVMSFDPALATANTDSLTIDDGYSVAMTHYVASRCLGEDGDDSSNLKLSLTLLQQFQEAL